MSLPDRRIAADGTAYIYTDFVDWYGHHANKLWEEAAHTKLCMRLSASFVLASSFGLSTTFPSGSMVPLPSLQLP